MSGRTGMRRGLPAARGLYADIAASAKPSKYGAHRTIRDGIPFASKLEADRWTSLQHLERIGQISGLERQVKFPLMVGDFKIGDYIADFRYFLGGGFVIEDAKGVLTPLCAWKLKHMSAQGNTVTLWPARKPKAARRKKALP